MGKRKRRAAAAFTGGWGRVTGGCDSEGWTKMKILLREELLGKRMKKTRFGLEGGRKLRLPSEGGTNSRLGKGQ